MEESWRPGEKCECGCKYFTEDNEGYACNDCGLVYRYQMPESGYDSTDTPQNSSETQGLPKRLRDQERNSKRDKRRNDAEKGQLFFEDNLLQEMKELANCGDNDDRIKFGKALWIGMRKSGDAKNNAETTTRAGNKKRNNSNTQNGRAHWKRAIMAFVLLKAHQLDNRSVQDQKKRKKRSFHEKKNSKQMREFCEEIKRLNAENQFRRRGQFDGISDDDIRKELSKYCSRVNRYLSSHAFEGKSSKDGDQTKEELQARISDSNDNERDRFLRAYIHGCEYMGIEPDLDFANRLFDQLLDHTGYSTGATTSDAKLRCYMELLYQFFKSRRGGGKKLSRKLLSEHITMGLFGEAKQHSMNKYERAAKDVLKAVQKEGDET
jgi:hypothetical protein